MEDMKKFKFGTVEWQDAMERNVEEKIKKGIALDAMEQAYMPVQAAHNERLGNKKSGGNKHDKK